jgi:hypothetical protein
MIMSTQMAVSAETFPKSTIVERVMNGYQALVSILRKPRIALVVLTGMSFVLRIILVSRGGQLYWPDEAHYFDSVELVRLAAGGDVVSALNLVLNIKAHVGFLLLGTIPATLQYFLQVGQGLSLESTVWIPALMLSTASVASIAVTAAIARRGGAGRREAFIAALLMASATSMFYFSRHVVPYDLSLAIALLALWVGLDPRPGTVRSVICGMLASLAFFTYYGFWTFAGIVWVVHVIWGKPKGAEIVRRGIAAGTGFVALPVALSVASLLRGMEPFVLAMAKFADSVNQGTQSEGWRLPWEYLWDAEHGLLIIWIIGVLAVIWFTLKQREIIQPRVFLWLGIAAAVYLILFIGSTGLEKFVVYGRLVKQLVPFFCLITAFSANCFLDQFEAKRPLVWLGAIALLIQIAFNFATPLTQQFPLDIERQIQATYGQVGRALTVKGPPVFGYDPNLKPQYVLLNAQYLYPISGTRKPPDGRIIFQTAHPLQFLPYQFEGHDPGERAILQSVDLSMRLIDVGKSN